MAKGKHLTDELVLTYQARLAVSQEADAALSDIACLASHIEREIYVRTQRTGEPLMSLKSEISKKYNIPNRYYTAIRIGLDAKIKSALTNLDNRIVEKEAKIDSKKRLIKKLGKALKKKDIAPEKEAKTRRNLHSSRRKLDSLGDDLKKLKDQAAKKDPKICFGSKKLFHKQYSLEANGYKNHDEWLAEWQASRVSQFSIVGSKDEKYGSQLCALTENEDGSYDARIRVPDALAEKHGPQIVLQNIRLAYGDEVVRAAVRSNQRRNELSGKKAVAEFGDLYKQFGQALTFRFVKKPKKGWYIFISVDALKPSMVSEEQVGTLGVDINGNFLAVALTDRFGNPVNKWTIPCNTYGKSSDQTNAEVGEACKAVVDLAVRAQVPIVIEKLNFKQKKAGLTKDKGPRYARMLCGLAYSKIKDGLVSRAYRHGVEVFAVNPAHTSTIGRAKLSKKYGFSTHHGAAVAIARRYNGFSERLPRNHTVYLWDDKAGTIALPLPADNGRPVTTRWGMLGRKLRSTLVALFRGAKAPPRGLGRGKAKPKLASAAQDPVTTTMSAKWQFCEDMP